MAKSFVSDGAGEGGGGSVFWVKELIMIDLCEK
jgi:hypothetical protein